VLAFLSAEVSLLDPPKPPSAEKGTKSERGKKRESDSSDRRADQECPILLRIWLAALDDFRNWLLREAA
jgi:hypothetical protein